MKKNIISVLINPMRSYLIVIVVIVLTFFDTTFATDAMEKFSPYSRTWELKHYNITIAPLENTIHLSFEKKDRLTHSGKMNMPYALSSMALTAIIDVIVLSEVKHYYDKRGKPVPKFYYMEGWTSWNEALTIPGLLITWGFRQLPETDDRLWLYSSTLALAGVEDIFFQWLVPLYPRHFKYDYLHIFKEGGYTKNGADWLYTPEQPIIWIFSKFFYNGDVPGELVYISGFIGFTLCYTF